MKDLKDIIETYIRTGLFVLADLENRLARLYAFGKLTETDYVSLLALAAEYAKDSMQIDIVAKLKELEDRIHALEHPAAPEYAVWVSGYVTKRGEIVRFDYDKDGTLDLLRYDGGRESTTLSPGKIDGWHVVDESGNILGTYYNGQFTPFEQD